MEPLRGTRAQYLPSRTQQRNVNAGIQRSIEEKTNKELRWACARDPPLLPNHDKEHYVEEDGEAQRELQQAHFFVGQDSRALRLGVRYGLCTRKRRHENE